MSYQNQIEKKKEKKYQVNKPVALMRPKSEFGDYSTTVALELAKDLDQSPRDIANELVQELSQNTNMYDVSVAGPGFINFRVKASSLAEELTDNWSDNYGSDKSGLKKTVIVEYPSNNMAKPYSIGHLRSGN